MKKIDLTDRKNCFYWQTDRNLTAEQYKEIFLERQNFSSSFLQSILQKNSTSLKDTEKIEVVEPDRSVLKGNVNIVRKIRVGEKDYVVRMHPPAVKNGYFFAEAVALQKAKENGLPVPEVLEVHIAQDDNDMDFMVMTQSPGMTMEFAIQEDSALEVPLLREAGQLLAYVHQIPVEKYGFFDNAIATKEKKLVGLHDSFRDFIFTGLQENIDRLLQFKVITTATADTFLNIFETMDFSVPTGPRLLHNDYADWNILVNEKKISAILDWDECFGGDPVADLACWSTFFDIKRFAELAKGYQAVSEFPEDFEERFHYYRLRYVISKMALRVKRAQVDTGEFVREKIKVGEKAMQEELAWFEANYQL